jgi:hypothetical protein
MTVDDELQDPVSASVLANVCKMMNQKVFPENHVEVLVGRSFRQNRFTIYDAWVMSRLHFRYFTGGLLSKFVQFQKAGVVPHKDKERDKNNESLSWLQKPFTGEFIGGTGIGDGYLEWNRPIAMRLLLQNPKTGKVHEKKRIIRPARVPLEVGSSSHYCTWHHMWDSWGVARWPYGHEYITLLLRNRHRWSHRFNHDLELALGIDQLDDD